MKKKYALALSGGGFKGTYQLGALRYLKEHWSGLTGESEMHFDVIAGVSVGALNGVMVAGNTFDVLEELWARVHQNGGGEIYTSGYLDEHGKIQLRFQQLQADLLPNFKVNAGLIAKSIFKSIGKIFNPSSSGFIETLLESAEKEFNKNFPRFIALADNDPLRKKLLEHVSLSNIPEDTIFRCGLVSLDDGLYYALSHKDFDKDADFAEAILASTAMPVIWPPSLSIYMGSTGQVVRQAVDGGIRNTSPLGDVVREIQADPESSYEVFIVNCNAGYITPLKKDRNIADIAIRTLTEITLAEIFNDDVRTFLKTNALVRQAEAKGARLSWKDRTLQHYDYMLIQPTGDELGETLDSRPERLRERELLGYTHAEAAALKRPLA